MPSSWASSGPWRQAWAENKPWRARAEGGPGTNAVWPDSLTAYLPLQPAGKGGRAAAGLALDRGVSAH